MGQFKFNTLWSKSNTDADLKVNSEWLWRGKKITQEYDLKLPVRTSGF